MKSDVITSTELIVDFIGKNVEAGNWAPFFNELRNPTFVPALMKRSRPEAKEFRSLDQATLVIDEYAPDEMPEDSWDRLAACHEWFVRWTQSVIPHAVWQQAMHTAEKTLLPHTER